MHEIGFRLIDTPGTHLSALSIIKNHGFDVGITLTDEDANEAYMIEKWFAKNDQIELIAGNPLRLLGLVTVWMERGSEWSSCNDENLYDDPSELLLCTTR